MTGIVTKHGWVKERTEEELLHELNRARLDLTNADLRVSAIRDELFRRRYAEYVARAKALVDNDKPMSMEEYIQTVKPVCVECQNYVTDITSHSIIIDSDSPVYRFSCERRFQR